MTYEHRLKVRYGETDQMGVVHHANYLLYLEEARTEYMTALGSPYAAVERAGVGLPVRKVDLRYRAPSFYDDRLVVRVRIGRVGAASVAFHYEIDRESDATRVATATVELACVALEGDRSPRMLPDDVRAILQAAGSDGP